jgi:scyllo-inositol 2-dehydrogenase (NADP+)
MGNQSNGFSAYFIKYGVDPQEEQLKKAISPINSLYGVENEENYGCLYTEFSSAAIETEPGYYKQYYLEIAQAIKLDGFNPVNPTDAVEILNILELAEMSSESGKKMMITRAKNYHRLK